MATGNLTPPEGFTLDSQTPSPPDGFTLDGAQAAPTPAPSPAPVKPAQPDMRSIMEGTDPFAASTLGPNASKDDQFKDIAARAKNLQNWYDTHLSTIGDSDQDKLSGVKQQYVAQRDALNKEADAKGIKFNIFKPDEENLSDQVQAAKLTSDEMRALLPKKLAVAAPALAATERGLANLAGGAQNPENLALAATGALPEELAGLAAKSFAGSMVAGGTAQTVKGIQDKSGEEIATGVLTAGLPFAFKAASDLRAISDAKKAAAKEGDNNASSEQKTAEVHGNVQPQPVSGEGEVPAKESSGGVQPQTTKSEVALKPPEGDRLVTVQRPDGSTYQAAFGDKFWDLSQFGMGDKVPSVAKPLPNGGWTHTPISPGEKIIEPEPQVESVTPLDPQSGNPIVPKLPEKQPEMVGMGAATPSEFEPVSKFATSTKNAVVDQERVARGLPPMMKVAREGFPQVWDDAMRRVEDNPQITDHVVKEISQTGRPVDWLDLDTQNALLLHKRVELRNSFDKAISDLNQHIADNYQPGIEEANLRRAQISDQMQETDSADKLIGTQVGRGLNARKMMANEDYSLSKMETTLRGAKDGERLTPEEHEFISDLHDKLKKQGDDYEKHIADLKKKISELESGKAVKEIVKETVAETAKEKTAGTKRDFNGERARLTEGLKNKVADKIPKEELGPWIQRLAKTFVAQGVRDSDELTDKVHDIVKGIIPDMSRNDTMNAISGYGDFKQLSKDEVSVELRRMKGELQQLGKIEDMQKGKAPLKTGVERRAPGLLERNRIKIVNEMKRKLGLVVTDPAKQLQSALGAIKTRLRHQIDDLDLQIASGKKILNSRTPTQYDAEATALKAQRDELKKQFDSIFGKRGLTDQQRIDMAGKAIDRQVAEIQRQLKTGEIFPVKQVSKTPASAMLDAKRANLDALKETRQYLREAAQPRPEIDKDAIALKAAKSRLKTRIADLQDRLARGDLSKRERKPVQLDEAGQKLRADYERTKLDFDKAVVKERLGRRSTVERSLDGIAKWRRAFVLTYPTILAKLTSASAELMALTPLESAAGSAIRRLIPGVAEKAPRYGSGLQIKAEVDAIAHTWKTLFSAFGQKLKTGRSDIDLLYGNEKIVPKELKDYISNLHGALKESARQHEFSLSMSHRLMHAAENGVDVTDPTVQAKIGLDAYRDANAKIFQENNTVADFVQRGLTAFHQENKTTGRVPWSKRVAGTAFKYEFPIVKIPLNIVKRAFEYSFGTVIGSVRYARALSRGLDNLTPEESDIIMRNLARGSVGLAVMALGFFNPEDVGGYYQTGEKRKPGDVKEGGVRIYGVNIPRVLVHNPLLEQLQIGATLRKVIDSKLHKSDKENQSYTSGLIAAYGGLIGETPFVQQAEDSMKALNPNERQQFLGELLKSTVPGVAQWAAGQLDQNNLTPASFLTGTPRQVKPVTPGQYLESAIPGLRQNVPGKKPAGQSN